ncbi:glycerate kinase [Muricauda sp. 2012CJ35-5]|uniref:Glycerate kinase n=1 Tax=Flagellimonas spongiicola TaxID=2942208 RepID=A0ABT0PT51_9FLAO|nr:glycerate kinase [Allomuricauda spongiicola]MCL6274565.1 glycerate kinase [Allomuricauda spongiicola]
MKFVIAPDKYKGSLSGAQFCNAVENGILQVFPKSKIIKKPLADGGDGTLEVVQQYLNATLETVFVQDPLFREINATYLLSQDKKTAYVEMSEASGYKLLQHSEMNCMHTTSLGTGQLIVNALDQGVQKIILGIGGSATNDGGMGLAQALGYRFYDGENNPLEPVGKNLDKVQRIEKEHLHPRLNAVAVQVACDVNNPFYGAKGAAHIYGAQKGASPEEIEILDNGLRQFAQVIHLTFGLDVQGIPGAGAAGGMGAGAKVFMDAELTSGVDLIMELANFKSAVVDADWIITGEGQLDGQTLSGKTINGVLQVAASHKIPVAALCGSITLTMDQIQDLGLQYAVSILNEIGDLEKAKSNSFSNLELASFNFARLLNH